MHSGRRVHDRVLAWRLGWACRGAIPVQSLLPAGLALQARSFFRLEPGSLGQLWPAPAQLINQVSIVSNSGLKMALQPLNIIWEVVLY